MSIKTSKIFHILGGAVFALSSHGVLAQAVKDASAEQAENRVDDGQMLQEVVVQGIRSSYEDALAQKRMASSIVDHISAEDIGSLPALDLGEALQAIPGVQLNAEDSQRTSSINLRGLSGGYVLTTANGHGFASPSLSRSEKGAANPFGAFESSIFRGVTVIKTPTADMPTGAIAGVVDNKLPKALEMSKDRFELNVGTRYEELADSFDNEFSFRGRKELIEGKLAIAGTYAQSDQNFRRDSLNITRYSDAERSKWRVFKGENGQTMDEYKAENGIPAEANMLIMSEARQFSELAEGDRQSYALNVQWAPTDKLNLNLDFLGTEKDLNDATSDVFIFGIRGNNNYVGFTPTAGVAPVFAFTEDPVLDEEGNVVTPGVDNYLISDYSYENGQYFPGARLTDRYEQSDGIFFDGSWTEEDWTLSFGASTSDAEASTFGTQFDARYNPAPRNPGGGRSPDDTNGITGQAVSGLGNLDDFLLTMNGTENLTLAHDFAYGLRSSDNRPHEILDRILTQSSVTAIGVNPDGTKYKTAFLIGSSERLMEREHDEFKVDFEYQLDDMPFFDSVKVGAFSSKEEYNTRTNRPVPAFINLDGVTDDLLVPAVHTQGTGFFDGNLPGALGADDGWLAIDAKAAVDALTVGVAERYADVYQDLIDDPTVEEGNTASDALTNAEKQQALDFYSNPKFTEDGFLARVRDKDVTEFHSAKVEIKSAYFMARFSGEIGSMAYRGNAGLRYAETTNSGSGLVMTDKGNSGRLWDNTYELSTPSHKYSHTLPSLNFSLDLTEDLILRSAYYEGISRPNLAAFKPNGSVNEGDRTINVQVADTELLPFEADSFDLSLNWYNRPGSVVSVGFFQKDVRDQSDVEKICPTDGGGFGYGSLSLVGTGASAVCEQDELYTIVTPGEAGSEPTIEEINREVNITQRVVKNDEQTVRGYEIAVQQNFDFLPGFLSNFGGIVNYSRVTNDGDQIEGISERSYNVVGYYEKDKFNARLAYNYRSSYLLATTGTFTGFADREAKDRKRLDFSTSYEVIDNMRVTVRAYNILNDVFEEYQGGNEALGRRANYDGRIYSLSARYVF